MNLKSVLFPLRVVRNVASHIARKTGWPQEPNYTKHFEGLLFTCRMTPGRWDERIITEVVKDDIYGLRKMLTSPKVVVDIGGNIGSFAVYAASLHNCDVYSFEPLPENYWLAQKNFCQNSKMMRGRVVMFNQAVTKDGRYVRLYVDEDNFGSCSINKPLGLGVLIRSTTLESILERIPSKRINLLKIDAEGAEYEILLSSGHLMDKIDEIVLEYHNVPFHPEFNKKALSDFLNSHGFTVRDMAENMIGATCHRYTSESGSSTWAAFRPTSTYSTSSCSRT